MKQRILTVLLTVIMIFSFTGCTTVKASTNPDTIVGEWSDAYGLTKYQFQPDGKMKIQALNLGSFKGTYQIEDDRITIQYRILMKDIKNTYQLKLDGNTLYLDKNQFTRKK
ncbi:DUF5640 domain-containing protein [Caproiciproducens sp. LBM24188]|nr:hypothetical protein [Oscillospiraceae bacterium]HHV30986.1 hypothetical protein [Clostridiales bacterium]